MKPQPCHFASNAECLITSLNFFPTKEYAKNVIYHKVMERSINTIKKDRQNFNPITIKLHRQYFLVMRILHAIINSSMNKMFQLQLLVVVIYKVRLSISTNIKNMTLVILSTKKFLISLIRTMNGWKNELNREKKYWCIAWEVFQEVPVL